MTFYQILTITFFIICVLLLSYFIYIKYLERRRKKLFAHGSKITNPGIIAELLNSVKNSQNRIQLTLGGRGSVFASSILEVHSKHILIDALFPKEGNSLISDSEFIEVGFFARDSETALHVLPYVFTSTYLDTVKTGRYTSFKIALPTEIDRNQKREYMRIDPAATEPIFLTLNMHDAVLIKKIANISAGGLSFYTEKTGDFSVGQTVENVTFVLPDGSSITCAIAIRNIMRVRPPVVISNKPHYYRCGAEFLNIDRLDRDNILKYVIDTERKELRRNSRGFE